MIKDHLSVRHLQLKDDELQWEPVRRTSGNRLDVGAYQIGRLLYVFGGYQTVVNVLNCIDVMDLQTGKWIDQFEMPKDMPQTHLGIACEDKRYVYTVSGQLGGWCAPAVPDCFVLDTQKKTWDKLPSLPEVRYAPAVQLWNGRLHVAGGAKFDRCTPAVEHWSIAVKDGQAKEKQWRKEVPLPSGMMHCPNAVLDGKFFVCGGQQGDWIAIPGDEEYKGIEPLSREKILNDTYMLEPQFSQWVKVADMPIGCSQNEFCTIKIDDRLLVLGGMVDNQVNPDNPSFEVTDAIQLYDATKNSWEIIGRLPYRVKSGFAAFHDNWLYIGTGQRDCGPDNPDLGPYEDRVWRAKFIIS